MTYIFYALAANVCFSTSSLMFAKFTDQFSANWMNLSKALIAAISFLVVVLLFSLWSAVNLHSYLLWGLSGVLGLIIGDYFLMNSFARLGPGRALMLDSFQPLLMGILSYYFLHQTISSHKLIAIVFLILCVINFGHESYKQSGHWELKGSLYALIGTSMEGISMFIARIGFDLTPNASPFLGNLIRSSFAFMMLFILGKKMKINFQENLNSLLLIDKIKLIMACFFGTFISLSFYLKAIQFGNLAIISAIAVTSPLFASGLEILINKKKITSHFIIGTILFLSGATILLLPN